MSLTLEVRDTPVRVVGFDGLRREARFYLRAATSHATRPESVGDRLNEAGAEFLPARIGDRVELLHLAWIAYVACSGRLPEVAEREEVGARRSKVELSLVGGATLSGELLYTLPPDHSRVSDLLNVGGERFILLVTREETIFVHRAAIVSARTE